MRDGKPCIKGTRITVNDALEYLAGGMTEAQILADFPALKPEQIRACLAFTGARERRLAVGIASWSCCWTIIWVRPGVQMISEGAGVKIQ